MCGGAQGGRGFAVDVDLAGDEEEVVADAVEEDAAPEHPHSGAGISVGKEQVADGPGEHAGDEHVLDSEAAEEPGDEEHAEEFGHLSAGHLAGCVLNAGLVEKEVGEGVVELQRDADEEGRDGEDGHGAFAEELEGFFGEDGGGADAGIRCEGRGVGEGEAVERHDERCGCGETHGEGCGFELEVADEESGYDPSAGAEDADGAELGLGVLHLAEGEGVGEREGGHEAETIEQDEGVEGKEDRLAGGGEEKDGSDAVEDSENFLRGEELVRDQADEEGRDDGSDGGGSGCEAHLLAGKVLGLREPCAYGDVP